MMVATLILPEDLAVQLAALARTAFPAECCGLIEGRIEGQTARVLQLHPTRNLGEGPDRFEIDPAAQIRLLKALRGTDRAVIGCFHSHPNGRAEPSATDLAGASEEGFVWLIQPLTAEVADPAAGFEYADGAFHQLAISS